MKARMEGLDPLDGSVQAVMGQDDSGDGLGS
jgi:hypothetical protein